MWMRYILAMALLVGWITLAKADTNFQECRRLCGADEKCVKHCEAHHHHPHRHHRHHRHPYYRTPQPTPYLAKPPILETGYDFLYAKGSEEDGYALYSYVILRNGSDRELAFMREILSRVQPVRRLPTDRNRTNILYIPTETEAHPTPHETARLYSVIDELAFGEHTQEFLSRDSLLPVHYNFSMATLLLDHLCDKPAEAVKEICGGDLSGGPYILTYGTKISDLSPLPPPFLLVDLTTIHQGAFGQVVSAYLGQVKAKDFSDRTKIDTFRLKLLNLMLIAAELDEANIGSSRRRSS